MLSLKIISIWAICIQISVCLSPHALIAVANVQTQRNRALANALNRRARAQYNTAMARSRTQMSRLGDRRIRNSDEFFPEEDKAETQVNAEGGQFPMNERLGMPSPYREDEGLYVIPGGGSCNIQRVADDDDSQNDVGGANDKNVNCPNCHAALRIPSQDANADNIDQHKNLGGVDGNNNFGCPVCQQIFSIQSEESRNTARQGGEIDEELNVVDFDQSPEIDTDFAGPPDDTQLNEDIEEGAFPDFRSNKEKAADPHLHHQHKHEFSHSHTHSHFHDHHPLHKKYEVPPTQVVPSAVNVVHVTQNQNAGLNNAHSSPASYISPSSGKVYSSGGYSPLSVLPGTYDNTNGGHVVPHTGLSSLGTLPGIHGVLPYPSTRSQVPLGALPGAPSTKLHQSQSVETVHGGQVSVSQNQLSQTGVSREAGVGDAGAKEVDPRDPKERRAEPDDIVGSGQERMTNGEDRLGTFLLPNININNPTYPPDYNPQYFDPTQPQNRQNFVKYIEDEQKTINQMLHYIERTNHQNMDQAMHTFNGNNKPYHPSATEQYEEHEEDGNYPELSGVNVEEVDLDEAYRRSGNRRKASSRIPEQPKGIEPVVGQQFPFDLNTPTVPITPVVPLPANFQLSPEMQTRVVQKYFDTEQKDVQEAMQLLHEEHQHNWEELMSSLSGHPSQREQEHHPQPMPEQPPPQHHHHPQHTPESQPKPPPMEQTFDEDQNGDDFQFPHGEEDERKFENPMFQEEFEGNDPRIQGENENNPIVANLIRVPERRYPPYYQQRRARSPNEDAVEALKGLLMKEKKLINELTKEANLDEDLKMIGYIGDSFVKDLENRLPSSIRVKRENGDREDNLRRLFSDPKMKFDMPTTLDNLGAVARTTFEHEAAPMYHVRNMAGSARNAVIAAMKIPNQNVIIPSDYEIVKNGNDNVGAINTEMVSRSGASSDQAPFGAVIKDEVTKTFHKVGSAIRSTVKSGQEALGHVGEAVNHAKDAIYSTRHTAPKVVWKRIPAIAKEPLKKAMTIAPRIFGTEENEVGNKLENLDPDYVKVGHILDAVGVSSPNVDLQQIIVQPRNYFFPEPKLQMENQNLREFLDSMNTEKVSVDQLNFVGTAMNSLQSAQASFGTLKDFLDQMKKGLQQILRSEIQQRQPKRRKNTMTINQKKQIIQTENAQKTNNTATAPPKTTINKPADSTLTNVNPEETVGAGLFLSDELLHPFMNQPSPAQIRQFLRENHDETEQEDEHNPQNHNGQQLGPILGAINPMMFERMFNESLKSRDPHSKEGEYEEQVSTMAVTGQMLKPFMGQASIKNKKDFFDKYQASGVNDQETGYGEESSDNSLEYTPIDVNFVDDYRK